MLSDWEKAQRIQRFLAEFERRSPNEAANERSTAWRTAVAAYAARLDPLGRPEQIAKELNPSDETLEQLVTVNEREKKRH